ncbi:MAG: hypothetical protein WCV71_00600 [Patescibacteria group bacterium]
MKTLLLTIAILICATTVVRASEGAIELHIRSENDRIPVTGAVLRDGDSVDFKISEHALVTIDSKECYFKVIKNSRHLATIKSGEEALIVFGQYQFMVYETKGDKLVATMSVHTIHAPLGQGILALFKSLMALMLLILAVVLAKNMHREQSIKSFRKRNPTVWKILP